MSLIRTGLLLLAMTALFVIVGYLLGGQTGILIALALSLVTHVWSYWASDSIVLRMHGAELVDERTAPEFYGIVRELSQRAGLPMPKVCIMRNPQPNAFATGRNPSHAAVCATTGLLETLNREEVAGVIAHELAHVKNRDTLTMAMAATLAGAVSMLANFSLFFGARRDERSPIGPWAGILVALAAPFAAMLIQMAISRSREFEADRGGAEISGDPQSLASALQKIHRVAQGLPLETTERHPENAQMMIINPLSAGGLRGLFSTHPSTEERVARLLAMR
jgi:heat shock protein HtpX